MAGINAGVEIFEAELPYAGNDRGNGSWRLGRRVDPGDQDGDGLFADVGRGQPIGGRAVHGRCWIVADASSSSESVLREMEGADGGLADSAIGWAPPTWAGSVWRELAYVICARWQVWWRLEHQSQKKEDLEKGRAALAILACCMQVQAVAAKEEKVEEEDQGDYNALVGFGILVALFTALAIKVAAMVKEACEKRSRGEYASIRAMRGHNKMPAGDEEEESEEEASSSSRASASTTRRRSTTTGGGGGSEALGARPKAAPEALRGQVEKGKGGIGSGKGKGRPIFNSPWRRDYARRNPTPPWRREDQPPANDQERQLVQIDEAVHNERWGIEDEELFFNKKDRIAHRTRECAGSRAEARYVCTWCFEQELRMQDGRGADGPSHCEGLEAGAHHRLRGQVPLLPELPHFGGYTEVERLRQVPTMRQVRQDRGVMTYLEDGLS